MASGILPPAAMDGTGVGVVSAKAMLFRTVFLRRHPPQRVDPVPRRDEVFLLTPGRIIIAGWHLTSLCRSLRIYRAGAPVIDTCLRIHRLTDGP